MLSAKLKEAAGNSADATLYVDDVFSTWLYPSINGDNQIINNIDLSGKGGLVWIKSRDRASNHYLIDTVRGSSLGNTKSLSSNTTTAQTSGPNLDYLQFNNNGFTAKAVTGGGELGTNVYYGNMASWTFRKAAKFFDVVTYTGTGSARTIAHSLGIAPGMVIVKRTDTTGNWQVYSNGMTSAAYSIQLNLTAAQASAPTVWNSTAPTSSVFSVGTDATVNASGGTYVAYLYAHDTSSTGIIQCGSFTTTGSLLNITLGYEPQWLMLKRSDNTGDWYMIDSMRGFVTDLSTGSTYLIANSSAAENSGIAFSPTATGFTTSIGAGSTYIYMAIRRPNKPPTTGTQVFALGAEGLGAVGNNLGALTASDLTINSQRALPGSTNSAPMFAFIDRLRGIGQQNTGNTTRALYSNSTASEVLVSSAFSSSSAASANGATYLSESSYSSAIYVTGQANGGNVGYSFKRAPGFFDEVCYTGDGVASRAVPHNLTSVPELIIFKTRNSAQPWIVYSAPVGATKYLILNQNFTPITDAIFANTTPTASVFYVNGAYSINSGATVVAYLFATLAGISKVGSYTGNGTGQAIACGFGSGGARFVLIKRTDAAGDWYTYDSARGLTSGSSPYLLLNSTAVEVTGNNGVYASSGGFTLGATAITTTNIATATYIFLAVA